MLHIRSFFGLLSNKKQKGEVGTLVIAISLAFVVASIYVATSLVDTRKTLQSSAQTGQCPTLNAPVISSPTNNSLVSTNIGSVLWYQPTGAVKYWVMIFDPSTGTIDYDSGKLQLAVQPSTVQNRYNFPAGSLNLTPGKQYSLEVYVENACGNVHGTSVNVTFTGVPPTNTPTPGVIEKKACAADTECGCGIDINSNVTTQCVFQNKKYLSTKLCRVANFCAGITGDCKPQCVNNQCERVCPDVTLTLTPTPSATPTLTPTPIVTTPPTGCTPVSTTWVNKAIKLPQGQFTVEFDVKPAASNIDGVIGLSAAQAGGFTDLATIVRFNTSGLIDVRDGSSYRALNSATYAPNIVYHIKMVVNPTTKKYSVSVRFPSGNELIIATDFAFRTEQANVANLSNLAAHSAVAAGLDLCSISIVSATITPNPTVCAMKKEGDADCKANEAGKQINLADFEIWRTEYYNGCDSQNLTAEKCFVDDDNDGSLMDANFDYPGSSTGYTDEAVKMPDFEIWRKAYFIYGV